jgi:isocitrate dehydrogenase
MFEYAFKMDDAANIIRKAVEASIAEGVVTVDIDPAGKGFFVSAGSVNFTNYLNNNIII